MLGRAFRVAASERWAGPLCGRSRRPRPLSAERRTCHRGLAPATQGRPLSAAAGAARSRTRAFCGAGPTADSGVFGVAGCRALGRVLVLCGPGERQADHPTQRRRAGRLWKNPARLGWPPCPGACRPAARAFAWRRACGRRGTGRAAWAAPCLRDAIQGTAPCGLLLLADWVGYRLGVCAWASICPACRGRFRGCWR